MVRPCSAVHTNGLEPGITLRGQLDTVEVIPLARGPLEEVGQVRQDGLANRVLGLQRVLVNIGHLGAHALVPAQILLVDVVRALEGGLLVVVVLLGVHDVVEFVDHHLEDARHVALVFNVVQVHSTRRHIFLAIGIVTGGTRIRLNLIIKGKIMKWVLNLNYIKNLKIFQKMSFGLELKTKAYLGLLIYWAIILIAPFSQ